jgi:N-hydroxyarylamine O-acetyltransferase
MFDTQSYLRRISYDFRPEPNAETLRKIHLNHMLQVPFENLDIHLNRPIELNVNSFFRKIVQNNRGGFCYELNGLFAELLKALGYSVNRLSARVTRADGSFGPDFDHMTLLVELEQRWIADVGFGDSFLEPLLLDTTEEQLQHGSRFRIIPSNGSYLYQSWEKDHWMDQYVFELIPHTLSDYREMCTFHQTSPESPFTRKAVCSRATASGRITLTDSKLIRTSGAERTESDVKGKDQFNTLLKEHFGITI